MNVRPGMLLLAILLMLPSLPAAGAPQSTPPILPIDQVRPGMRGIGKTVVTGQRVDEFQFEVIDILRGAGGPITSDRMILFRMTGPLVQRTGGSAAGMSGSPLYVHGRLIGALSASFIWQTPRRDIALATPIADMLKLLERPPARRSGAAVYRTSQPFVLDGRAYDRVVVAPTPRAAQFAGRLPGVAVAAPAVAAYALGLSPRASRLLATLVQPQGLEILQGYASKGTFAVHPVTAGSTVGVEEVRGDVEFGGICTVTVRVGARVLVCGHPWANQGDVEYILTAAEVIAVVNTLERPFKVGNLGSVIGVVDQDRGTGIVGSLGPLPRLFNLRVIVTDLDAGGRVQLGAQMVRRRDMARALAPLVALSAVERARNQAAGEGTATVRLTLRARGLERSIVRENMFYSTRDIATASVLDVVDAMELAFYNDLRRLEPYDLTVEISLARRRVTASIVDVAAQSREVSPGETLRVRVRLQPYLADRVVTRLVEVPVPADFPRGPAVVIVRSAGVDEPRVPVEARLASALQAEPIPWGVDSLQDALRLFAEFGRNTDILVRIVPFGLPATQLEFTKFDVPAARFDRTEWVIQGSESIPILIR
ncbi:MAG: SpoIVB peptidase S55 domain-containing protein [Armatimonadota bacterium]|nr:SpoIVB peptidase S55 domain-containing protein [Armatimonadota bacterium]MDR7535632.1 SpoIVB peptidase S55 domain-containing protein [Armatimonadota bacterium]